MPWIYPLTAEMAAVIEGPTGIPAINGCRDGRRSPRCPGALLGDRILPRSAIRARDRATGLTARRGILIF
jgi:hypothetical protein